MFGAALYVSGSNRRAALAARGSQRERRQRTARAARASRPAAARDLERPAARAVAALSGGRLTPIDFVAIVLVGRLRRRRGADPAPAAGRGVRARLRLRRGRPALVGRAPARKRRDAFMDAAPRPRPDALQRHPGRASRSPAPCRCPRASSTTRPRAEMAAVVQEMRLGQPLDVALERLAEAPALARGGGADVDDHHPAARGRRHRARAAGAGRDARGAQGPDPRDPHGARRAPSSRPTSWPASASSRSC